jgi:hypothetical protein
MIKPLKCLRCNHEWYQRRPKKPKVCPSCKRLNWGTLSFGRLGEKIALEKLQSLGYSVDRCVHGWHHDLLANNVRIDVKFCNRLKRDCWTASLMRGCAVLDESQTDVYLIGLVGYKKSTEEAPLWLIVPAPVGRTALYITLDSLKDKKWQYHKCIEDWDSLQDIAAKCMTLPEHTLGYRRCGVSYQ